MRRTPLQVRGGRLLLPEGSRLRHRQLGKTMLRATQLFRPNKLGVKRERMDNDRLRRYSHSILTLASFPLSDYLQIGFRT